MLQKLLLGILLISCLGCASAHEQQTKKVNKPKGTNSKKMQTLYVAGGCFWCVEAIFEELEGVDSVESGYAGGQSSDVTYEEVSSGRSGHAETVKINFDPKVISEADLLRIFFTVHDPTTLNAQGPDHGTQYRSAIFYANDAEKKLGQTIIDEVNKAKIWKNPIVTTLEPLKNWKSAESYHQDYWDKFENGSENTQQGMNYGYCKAIIEPKVHKFREKYASKLKKKNHS